MEKTEMAKPANMPEPAPAAPAASTAAAQPAEAATSAAAPKKNNALVIILVILGVLILCCGGGALLSYYLAQRAVTSVTDQLTNPSTAADIVNNVLDKTLNTDTSSGAVGKLIATWPSDVPVMPNAEIIYSSSQKEDNGTSFSTGYNVSQTTGNVESFYKTEMIKNGWALDNESTAFGFTLTFKLNNRETVVTIVDAENNKTSVIISINNI